ncbi:MAG: carbohydrate kinase [Lachnospiraceae bacterium]|nr:carbohydrate kinase [Lachnospiraceae bacterium]
MKQYDVAALGELLIDFTEQGMSGQGNPVFEANPGGAPCNVLAMLSRLGHRTAFLGKVGDDLFGQQLETALREAGIETRGLRKNAEISTTLAFVHTLPDGDREFSFYRNPGADMTLTEDDLEVELLEECRIFHFGTLSMTHEGCRGATYCAVERAKSAGAIISFDPNLRESLWSNPEEARAQILYGLGQCDILKISDNEIIWLTGETDYDRGVAWIRERFDIPLVLVSLGREGSLAFQEGQRIEVPAFLTPHTVETTGAGDTFCACILHEVLAHGWRIYTGEELTEMLHFANAAASIITTRKGALRVMPTEEEVWALMGE